MIDAYVEIEMLDALILAGWGDVPQTEIAALEREFGALPPLLPTLRNWDQWGDKYRWRAQTRSWLASQDGRFCHETRRRANYGGGGRTRTSSEAVPALPEAFAVNRRACP
jgi:hypothetical protein